jgi:hypothetical protein
MAGSKRKREILTGQKLNHVLILMGLVFFFIGYLSKPRIYRRKIQKEFRLSWGLVLEDLSSHFPVFGRCWNF